MTLESAVAHDTALDATTAEVERSSATEPRAPTGTPTTRWSARITAASSDDTGRWIGARLRSIREQKRLSLVDVERLSGGDLGTSTIGAYERGDRAISIPRLDRIADFYGVPIEQFLPRRPGETPPATRTSPISETLRIDLSRLDLVDGDPFSAVQRFVSIICTQRADRPADAITLRGADAVVVAAMLSVSTEAVVGRLRALDLLAPVPG